MKRITALALALLMLSCLISCQTPAENDPQETEDPNVNETTTNEDPKVPEEPSVVLPTVPETLSLSSETDKIKILGQRYLPSTEKLHCDWTCSGLEFVIHNNSSSLSFEIEVSDPTYFKVYVDGNLLEGDTKRDYFKVTPNDPSVELTNLPLGIHTLRLVKATGYTLSRAAILSMTYTGILMDPPAEKTHYIEFLGDSISCGWGLVGYRDGSYASQDGTLAYPYLLAEKLDADYAITALSGHGLLYPETNNLADGYGLCSQWKDSETAYAFTRKADVAVVNVGTNDFIYGNFGTDEEKARITPETFRAAYKNYLELIREKNGDDCKILCIYNSMNDTYSEQILSVIEEMGGASAGIVSYRATGTNSSRHPHILENQEYVEDLLPVLKDLLK